MDINRIKSLIDGNQGAFSLIFETHWARVYAYFLKRTKDVDASVELTQQLFIKLWKYRSALSEEISLDSQLFKKSRQIYIDWLRMEARRRDSLVDIDRVLDMPQTDDLEEHCLLKHDLYKAIDALPKKRKEIFELKHIHGYSYKEIADSLGISVKTVDNQLLKANVQLRKLLYTSIFIIVGDYFSN